MHAIGACPSKAPLRRPSLWGCLATKRAWSVRGLSIELCGILATQLQLTDSDQSGVFKLCLCVCTVAWSKRHLRSASARSRLASIRNINNRQHVRFNPDHLWLSSSLAVPWRARLASCAYDGWLTGMLMADKGRHIGRRTYCLPGMASMASISTISNYVLSDPYGLTLGCRNSPNLTCDH